MPLNKQSKYRIMECFQAVDNILLGKSLKECSKVSESLKEDYLNTKGAMFTMVIDSYKLINHKPSKLYENVNVKSLKVLSENSAGNARANSKKLITSEKGLRLVRQEVAQILTSKKVKDVNKVINRVVEEKAMEMALDDLLMARALRESSEPAAMVTKSGRLVEDAYKYLRSALVEIAMEINKLEN